MTLELEQYTFYKDHHSITTHSVGQGDDRRIVLTKKGA